MAVWSLPGILLFTLTIVNNDLLFGVDSQVLYGLPDVDQEPLSDPVCSGSTGSMQSPINIDRGSVAGEFPWKQLGIHGYENPNSRLVLKNTGRAAVLDANGPFIMGGNLTLNERYRLRNVVFHWGSSEHTVDGKSTGGELQLIHYNEKYNSYENALGKSDGIVALGVFLVIVPYENIYLRPIINSLWSIGNAGSSVEIPFFHLFSLLPKNIGEFYRYQGSLTLPGCEDGVTWIVFKYPIFLSAFQLVQFRNLKDGNDNTIYSNVRPVQPLNGRNVFCGQETPSWSHNGNDGQNVWTSRISEDCGGRKQSPVNINTFSTVVEASWTPLIFTNFDKVPESMTLMNNDHGAVIDPNKDFKATMIGGPFQTPYRFFHYHFHWGSPYSNGAEHLVDGRRYAGEVHMLIYREDLGLVPSLGVKGAFLEVSIFLELSVFDNPKLESVIQGLENIGPSRSETSITPFPLENLLPNNRQDYFFYDGSFTAPAPTCSELIDFLLFREPVPISRNQISRFFNLEDAAGNKILNNYRRLQPLNGRTIFRSPSGSIRYN